jgi:hypothetical protein
VLEERSRILTIKASALTVIEKFDREHEGKTRIDEAKVAKLGNAKDTADQKESQHREESQRRQESQGQEKNQWLGEDFAAGDYSKKVGCLTNPSTKLSKRVINTKLILYHYWE